MTIRRGLLSDYFEGVAVKKLSAVEADASRSNQHEYNGVNQLKRVLGDAQPVKFPTRFIWLGEEQEAVSEDGFLTWYDAREKHPTRSEYRLYFPTTPVSAMARAGDVMFIARRTDGTAMVIITPADSTMQNQLLWLFGIEEQPGLAFEVQQIEEDTAAKLDFAARYVLDELGLELEEPDADRLDALIEKFGLKFPTTREFSDLARASLPQVSALDAPDEALLEWINREEQLFRRLERVIVADRLKSGFMATEGADVDGFLNFSLSVQNRRKSRAGQALENHLEALFQAHGIRFDRGAETENRNKPDFLFPGQAEYRNPVFPAARLTMLGSKSTLKDRWRQVLSEAERIDEKHLLTLEPSVSENQTDEMRAKRLQLVLPAKLHKTYKPAQQGWLMDVSAFIRVVQQRQ
jgi:hypothetical protein